MTIDLADINVLLKNNSYPGRGIIIGCSPDGRAVIAYFIMGRSVNSRNRVFEQTDYGMRTRAFDETKLSDPSLIIYNPYRFYENYEIITNGDQTDTVYESLKQGGTFEEALYTREFEPDAPNYTPRISGIIKKENGGFSYKLSILKSADGDPSDCRRFFFGYGAVPGAGHFIHTYRCDGSPIPSFEGEPVKVAVPDDAGQFADELWQSLNSDNKVSLFVKYTDVATGAGQTVIKNKNSGD